MPTPETLLEKFRLGTLTGEERRQLAGLLDDPAGRETIAALLGQALSDPGLPLAGDTETMELIYQQIVLHPDFAPTAAPVIPMTPRRRFRPWLAAASVLLLLGIGIFLWRRPHPISTEPTIAPALAKNDLPPGHSGAILTLSGGRTIVLDSAANGTVAVQGRTRLQKTNNRLEYVAPSQASGEKGGEVAYNTLTTPRGRQYDLVLPDGSRVWLNAASSITYPTAFTDKERKVTITGEAYLEVTTNEARPFLVTVGRETIAVLGTSFNVNAYADEPGVKTTLIRGKVKVSAGGANRILDPGQQATVNAAGIALVPHADLDEVLAWKNGRFAFRDADLPTVMRQLARWYDVDVSYEGKIPHRLFNGKIAKTLTLDQLLRGLSHTRVHYTIEPNRHLIIRP